MNNNKLPVEEYLPIMLSAAAALGIFPFAIIRFVTGDLLVALLDAVLVASLAGLAVYSYWTQKTRVASVCLALLCVVGVLSTIYMRGASQAYWLYPVLVAVYFLIRRKEALLLTSLTVLALLPVLTGQVDPMTLTAILITSAVTCAFAFAFATVTRSQRDVLIRLARKDPLTGVGNRRALSEKLDKVIAANVRTQAPASMLMLDLDHFKRVNDRYGHATGDQILVRLTEIIKRRLRVTDSVYRIGGEEFVVVVDGQNLTNASRLAEQLRTIIEGNALAPAGSVTISLGVAQHQTGESADSWLRRADSALYEAKEAGRNTIKLAA